MESAALRAVCYGRVSTEEQGRSGHSLDAQMERTKAFCVVQGFDAVASLADAGVSGAIPPGERAGLGDALEMLNGGRADVLIVTDLDRLGRTVADVLRIADTAARAGWHLAILNLSMDTTTPMGRFGLTILAAVAELERNLISERTKAAMDELRRQGVRLGRPPNTEAAAVACGRARELLDSGCSMRETARRLNAEGVPTPTGEGRWWDSSLRRLLDSAA